MDTGTDLLDLLLAQHGALADLFASHQEALLDRRWAEAARLLKDYDRGLRGHIGLEEEHLLRIASTPTECGGRPTSTAPSTAASSSYCIKPPSDWRLPDAVESLPQC